MLCDNLRLLQWLVLGWELFSRSLSTLSFDWKYRIRMCLVMSFLRLRRQKRMLLRRRSFWFCSRQSYIFFALGFGYNMHFFVRRFFFYVSSLVSVRFESGMLIPAFSMRWFRRYASCFISIGFRMLLQSGFLSHLSMLLSQLIFLRGCWWDELVSFSRRILILFFFLGQKKMM